MKRKDLLNDDDRQELYWTLREMFADLGAEDFIIVALTRERPTRGFIAQIVGESEEPAEDGLAVLRRVVETATVNHKFTL